MNNESKASHMSPKSTNYPLPSANQPPSSTWPAITDTADQMIVSHTWDSSHKARTN